MADGAIRRRMPARGRGAVAHQSEAPLPRKRFGAVKKLLGLAALAALLYGGMLGAQDLRRRLEAQKIETVRIEGSMSQVSEAEVQRVMLPFMDESLIGIDLDQVKAALEAHPWIRRAGLRREWPHTLIVEVAEQVAIARWGKDSLLNQRGEIFRPPQAARLGMLPVLTGPDGSEEAVMEQYQKFSQLLYPLGLKVAALDMNSRGAWRLALENGVEIKVGKDQVIERMRRLAAFLDGHFLEGIAVLESIDLRYPNGIAVDRREAAGESAKDEVVSL